MSGAEHYAREACRHVRRQGAVAAGFDAGFNDGAELRKKARIDLEVGNEHCASTSRTANGASNRSRSGLWQEANRYPVAYSLAAPMSSVGACAQGS